MEPIEIEIGEWWYKGCFIQKQEHPKLSRYRIFKDTELQEEVGTSYNWMEAKRLCVSNEVKNYKHDPNAFLSRMDVKKETMKEKIIEKVLTLSTAHIKKSTADSLDTIGETTLPFRVVRHTYGYIIFVSSLEFLEEPSAKKVSKDLVRIIKLAVKKKCTLINLDADANFHTKFKCYDW